VSYTHLLTVAGHQAEIWSESLPFLEEGKMLMPLEWLQNGKRFPLRCKTPTLDRSKDSIEPREGASGLWGIAGASGMGRDDQ